MKVTNSATLFLITVSSSLCTAAVLAFQTAPMPKPSQQQWPVRLQNAQLSMQTMTDTIDYTDNGQRNVPSMQQWAQQCGAQTAEGVEISTQDGEDYFMITNQNIPNGSPVLFVPAQMVLSSSQVEDEYGENLLSSERMLVQYEGTAQRLPLFRLMIKVLAEYEKGSQSPYYAWLNSLPRRFYNGAAMTDACFACLPPYAAWLATTERNTYSRFLNAIREGYLPLSPQTLSNDQLVKWAYNVALTRFTEVWVPRREKKIAPMADMFNHDENANVDVTFDQEGNCMVNAIQDIPAGSQLTISLGDPSNPTPLFAKYGFLYSNTPTIFCKAMHIQDGMEVLGYDFKDLLFSTQTGEISPKVYDLFLYKLLENDPNSENFVAACKMNDEDTKQAYHGEYFQYTLGAMKDHVNGILHDIDNLNMKANSYDLNTHPRVPVIVAHNNLVKNTFVKVQGQLDAMG